MRIFKLKQKLLKARKPERRKTRQNDMTQKYATTIRETQKPQPSWSVGLGPAVILSTTWWTSTWAWMIFTIQMDGTWIVSEHPQFPATITCASQAITSISCCALAFIGAKSICTGGILWQWLWFPPHSSKSYPKRKRKKDKKNEVKNGLLFWEVRGSSQTKGQNAPSGPTRHDDDDCHLWW